ncbi:hypothetical protein [Vibrio mexicanus]|uniref:hypothetical protein n=1 Tax=Vibrio mexicanus TaxID=1004326 RepID=UPI000AC13BC3|nr:hypothetical protein [Vibrio mexicanus]
MVAAKYLGHERYNTHKDRFEELTVEYSVPEDLKKNIIEYNQSQYNHFISRAEKRYDEDIYPSMLKSAFTHKCLFMNGYEARRPFNSEPPKI